VPQAHSLVLDKQKPVAHTTIGQGQYVNSQCHLT